MEHEELFLELQQILNSNDPAKLREFLHDQQPADIAEFLEALRPAQRRQIFGALNGELAALVLGELKQEVAAAILVALSPIRLNQILAAMSVDDVVDLLGDLSEVLKERILGLMAAEDASEIEELLAYKEDTAGGIMTTEYVAFPQDITAARAIQILREIAPDAETVYYVYVIDARGALVGVISLRELIVAEPSSQVKEIMHKKVISVDVQTDQEEVARLVSRYNFLAVPVIDDKGVLVGIVTVDDIIDVIQEEATEDFYRLAGAGEVTESPQWGARLISAVKSRLPWLIITMLEGLLAGYVLGGLEAELQAIVALAFFIPLLTGMGGNVGTQSSTLTVRGLATGSLDLDSLWPVVVREGLVGVALGLFFGFMVGGIAAGWQQNLMLGLVVGLAMLGNMTTAAVMGTLVPMLFKRLGIDPAVASAPFISASIDITGLLIYANLATLLINYLL